MSTYDHKDQMLGTLPVLPVADVAKAAGYYTSVLGFTELFRQQDDAGVVRNAQVHRDGCHIMLNLNPDRAGQKGGGIYLWIRIRDEKIDDCYESVTKSGATVVEEIRDQFWGDRSFSVQDLNGYHLAFTQSL